MARQQIVVLGLANPQESIQLPGGVGRGAQPAGGLREALKPDLPLGPRRHHRIETGHVEMRFRVETVDIGLFARQFLPRAFDGLQQRP